MAAIAAQERVTAEGRDRAAALRTMAEGVMHRFAATWLAGRMRGS